MSILWQNYATMIGLGLLIGLKLNLIGDILQITISAPLANLYTCHQLS